MSNAAPIAELLWTGDSDAFFQAIELLRSMPSLIGPASIATAAVEDLEQLCFLEEAGPEYPRGLSDALSLRAAERLLDQMTDAERAVLSVLLEQIRAVHRAEATPAKATQLGYQIARANRDHNRVRHMVRLLLVTLEPLEERWDVWWRMPHAFAEAAPDIAARTAWEQGWADAVAQKLPRAAVRAAAELARDQAREEAAELELEATLRDTWLIAPPLIRDLLRAQVFPQQ